MRNFPHIGKTICHLHRFMQVRYCLLLSTEAAFSLCSPDSPIKEAMHLAIISVGCIAVLTMLFDFLRAEDSDRAFSVSEKSGRFLRGSFLFGDFLLFLKFLSGIFLSGRWCFLPYEESFSDRICLVFFKLFHLFFLSDGKVLSLFCKYVSFRSRPFSVFLLFLFCYLMQIGVKHPIQDIIFQGSCCQTARLGIKKASPFPGSAPSIYFICCFWQLKQIHDTISVTGSLI